MLKWLSTNTEKNPYCYFTPVFADYAKHLRELQEKYKITDDGELPTKSTSVAQVRTGHITSSVFWETASESLSLAIRL